MSDARVAKVIARAGVCSRRQAEELVRQGRVAVNGRPLESPACVVTDGDVVTVDGAPLPTPDPPRLWRLHKAAGRVTTRRDPQGRPTVFEALPPDMPRVISIGRLDLATEGLLLLTNDGDLARHLERPATGWARRYRVRVHGRVAPAKLEPLAGGVTVDGVTYGPVQAVLDHQSGSNAWLTVTLHEGRNREVRILMEHLGWPVSRLIRVAYGPFQLGNMARGAVEEVPARVLRDQLGRALWESLAGGGAAHASHRR